MSVNKFTSIFAILYLAIGIFFVGFLILQPSSQNYVIITWLVLFSFSIFVLIYVYKKFSNLEKLIEHTANIASGDLNVDVTYDFKKNDTYNKLAIQVTILRDALRKMLKNIDNVAMLHERGKIDELIDVKTNVQQGVYAEVTHNINKMLSSYSGMTKEIISSLSSISEGNFDIILPKYPGDKYRINQATEILTQNIYYINQEIKNLVESATVGKLDQIADETKAAGEFKEVFVGLNKLMSTIKTPLYEAIDVLENVSAGEFDKLVIGDYQGVFADIKIALNTTVTEISSYITEISQNLDKISHNNFDTEIYRDYIGQFKKIKTSMNYITQNLSSTMNEIIQVTKIVYKDADNVQRGSDNAAVSATEQESTMKSIAEISTGLLESAKQTSENAKNSQSITQTLTRELNSNAENGSEQMDKMIQSMSQIAESSNDIVNIIKVIESIASQTNLLSLNAAVEAARASEHGRGFAVVAEEVGSLAKRSSDAAKNIQELIQGSSEKIQQGYKIAEETGKSLGDIVEKVTSVANMITEISVASVNQTKDIEQIDQAIREMKEAVIFSQQNSINLAMSAVQLKDQAKVMEDMASVFTLRYL